jgi:ectoine hydroxylase-related dioxygenase (phytanoyl-CoA dioxygenase family)
VVQVNAPREEGMYGAEMNHRARGQFGVCRSIVSETLTRKGAIGSIAIALLGHDDARLFNDQYVAKPPARVGSALRASCFEWHHDSQWCDHGGENTNSTYLSCWVCLDDVSEENGTLRMLPYPPAASDATHRERASAYPPISDLPSPMSEDVSDSCGQLLTMRAGSVVFFSDVVLHCSGPNFSEAIRRAWMPQFSAGPILREDGSPVSLVARLG